MPLLNLKLDKRVYTTDEIDDKISHVAGVDLSDVVKRSDFPDDEDQEKSVLLDVYPYQDLDSVQIRKTYHSLGDGVKDKSFVVEASDGIGVNVVSEKVEEDGVFTDVLKLKFDAHEILDKIGAIDEVLDKVLGVHDEDVDELQALVDKILGTE